MILEGFKLSLQFFFSLQQLLNFVILLSLGLVDLGHEHSFGLIDLHFSRFVETEFKSFEIADVILCVWLVFRQEFDELSLLNTFFFDFRYFPQLHSKNFSCLRLEIFILFKEFFDLLLSVLTLLLQVLSHLFLFNNELVVNLSTEGVTKKHW